MHFCPASQGVLNIGDSKNGSAKMTLARIAGEPDSDDAVFPG
jgi:hypothetical protein